MVDYQVFGRSETASESHQLIGVLEVGSITNSDFRSSYHQYTKRFKGFDTSSLSESWAVMCEFGVVFRGLEERLTPLLRKMEERGLKTLARNGSDASMAELEQELAAIAGLIQVLQIPAGQRTTRVAIDFMWHTTGVTNPDSTLEVVEAFLSSNEKALSVSVGKSRPVRIFPIMACAFTSMALQSPYRIRGSSSTGSSRHHSNTT